eukprot:3135076-Prymnesium_polylepis.1
MRRDALYARRAAKKAAIARGELEDDTVDEWCADAAACSTAAALAAALAAAPSPPRGWAITAAWLGPRGRLGASQ